MQDFAFVDETLDINLTQSYYLSIQTSLNGLSFSILDPVRNKFIALTHFAYPPNLILNDLLNVIEQHLQQNSLLNYTYKKTKLIWTSRKNILIPETFFNKENLKAYFEFNHKLNDLDEIHYKPLRKINTYSVFAIPNEIANIFSKKFLGIEYYNQQVSFLEYILSKYLSEEASVFIEIQNNFIDIYITQNRKLLFYNNFTYISESDIIYFIMYVSEQFDLNKENTEFIFSGIVNKKSELFTKLNHFVKHYKFIKLPDNFSYSYTFNSIPIHYFTNLICINL